MVQSPVARSRPARAVMTQREHSPLHTFRVGFCHESKACEKMDVGKHSKDDNIDWMFDLYPSRDICLGSRQVNNSPICSQSGPG